MSSPFESYDDLEDADERLGGMFGHRGHAAPASSRSRMRRAGTPA